MRYVLFVCTHNAGRSQMAQAFFEKYAPDDIRAESAGQEPADAPWPEVVEAMREVGIDITDQTPKLLEYEIAQDSAVIITMGCGDACPICPGKRYEDWKLDDPAGQGIDVVRPIRDEIERRVRQLLTGLGDVPSAAAVPTAAHPRSGRTAAVRRRGMP